MANSNYSDIRYLFEALPPTSSSFDTELYNSGCIVQESNETIDNYSTLSNSTSSLSGFNSITNKRKSEWETNAASELLHMEDRRLAGRLIAFVLNQYKHLEHKLEHSALETDWNPLIKLTFSGMDKVYMVTLNEMCKIGGEFLKDITIEMSDLGTKQECIMVVQIYKYTVTKIQSTDIKKKMTVTSLQYGKTVYTKTDDVLEKSCSNTQEISQLPKKFKEEDFPVIQRIVRDVYNMELIMPVLDLTLNYESQTSGSTDSVLERNNVNNNNIKESKGLYTIVFNGIRTIKLDFIEYLLATNKNRINDICIECGGFTNRTLSISIYQRGFHTTDFNKHKTDHLMKHYQLMYSNKQGEEKGEDEESDKKNRSIFSTILNKIKKRRIFN